MLKKLIPRVLRRLRRPRLSPRVRGAIAARQTLGVDFFGGWDPADVDLFRRHARPAPAAKGMITDYLGIRTAAAFHPWAAHMSGTTLTDLPIPDDQLRAEAIEHFALLHSIENTPPDAYTIVEVGASYGPWVCAGGLLAKRAGKSRIRLVAVEASHLQFDLISAHLAENGLTEADAEIRLINGAAAAKAGPLLFPKIASAGDNGSQAVEAVAGTDYLGRQIEHEEIPGFALADIIPGGVTDLLHVDIQGSETEVLQASAALINERVRAIFVGTHARRIEGELLAFFHAQDWRLIRERPTQFSQQHSDQISIVGWTVRDGGQYWVNKRFEDRPAAAPG